MVKYCNLGSCNLNILTSLRLEHYAANSTAAAISFEGDQTFAKEKDVLDQTIWKRKKVYVHQFFNNTPTHDAVPMI